MTDLNAGKLINENKDNFTKIKIAAAIGLALVACTSMQVSTQVLAADSGYWNGFADYEIASHIYYPWSIVPW